MADYVLSTYAGNAICLSPGLVHGAFGGHDSYHADFPAESARFRTLAGSGTGSIAIEMYRQGQKIRLYIDGVDQGVITAANDGTWDWVTLATGVDATVAHTVIIGQGNLDQYWAQLRLTSGLALDTATFAHPGVFATYGDSTIAGTAGTSSDATLSDSWLLSLNLGFVLANRGLGGTTVKHFAASTDGETRYADITGISPAPSRVLIRYGLNDKNQVGGAETEAELQTAYGNMMTALTAGLPAATFYCETIIPTSPPTSSATWNTAISNAVAAVNTANGDSRCVVKSLELSAMPLYDPTAGVHTSDGVHPNAAGYVVLYNYELGFFDSTPPTVSSAAVPSAGTSIVLTMSESVLPASGVTGFTMTAAGRALRMSSVTRTGVAEITIGLVSAVFQGEAAKYSYSGGNVTDIGGNALATITNATAANNSTQAGGSTVIVIEDD